MKIFFLMLVLTISFKSYSQSEKETIEWIVSKIEEYGNIKIKTAFAGTQQQTVIYTDNTGFIMLKDVMSYSDHNPMPEQTFQFNLKDLKSISLNISPEIISLQTNGNQVTQIGSNKIQKVSNAMIILDWNAEKNLQSRFIKALKAMIEFNKNRNQNEAY